MRCKVAECDATAAECCATAAECCATADSSCLVNGAVSSIGFALVLPLGVLGFIKFLLWVVFVDCIGVGLVLATVMW